MTAAGRAHLDEHGWALFPGLLPAAHCGAVLEAFRREVKPDQAFLRARPGTTRGKPLLTEGGFVREPVRDLHLEPPRRFPDFQRACLALLGHPDLQGAVRALLGEDGVVVETNVYEGNPVTWAHQDGWYFDSTPPGRLIGAWIALEPIHQDAGRFFVCPGSHKLDMRSYGVEFDVAVNVAPYARLVLDVIRQEGLAREAPALEAGDAVFWTANTIHGTLETRDPARSRASMNLHIIPASCGYLRYRRYPVTLNVRSVGGAKLHFAT